MAVYDLMDVTPAVLAVGDVLNLAKRKFNSQNEVIKTIGSKQLLLPRGRYMLEVWGSASGSETTAYYRDDDYTMISIDDWCGTGGYAKGVLTLSSPTDVFLTPGGIGSNGGQYERLFQATRDVFYGSGGGTDIRLLANSEYNRVIVAGGGGHYKTLDYQPTFSSKGGGGGGLYGEDGGAASNNGKGGKPNGPGAGGTGYNPQYEYRPIAASFFKGGEVLQRMGSQYRGCPGGGGWYGGGYGGATYYGGGRAELVQPGAGGSGFTFSAETARYVPSGYKLGSQYYLTNTVNISGHEEGKPITEPDGTTSTGHLGEGYIRITIISLSAGLYVGSTSGKAIYVKDMYIGGTDGKAKRVVKGYIGGADGKARRFM